MEVLQDQAMSDLSTNQISTVFDLLRAYCQQRSRVIGEFGGGKDYFDLYREATAIQDRLGIGFYSRPTLEDCGISDWMLDPIYEYRDHYGYFKCDKCLDTYRDIYTFEYCKACRGKL
jgi:hypothetical protein